MQGLAKRGLLSQFHYLSTVSGGGYVGSWLMAWATRAAASGSGRTFKEIETELESKEAPEPLSELRKNQAFLTPKVGIASPDTWAAFAVVIRNMLLNWLVFVPLLASVLLIPRFIQSVLLVWTYSTSTSTTGVPKSIFIALWDKAWNPSDPLAVSWDPHTWLDGVAVLLVGSGILFAMVNRSNPCKRAINDHGFGKYVLLPVVLGAFVLVAQACSWLTKVTPLT